MDLGLVPEWIRPAYSSCFGCKFWIIAGRGISDRGRKMYSEKRENIEFEQKNLGRIIPLGKGEQQGSRPEGGRDVKVLAGTVVHEGSFPS